MKRHLAALGVALAVAGSPSLLSCGSSATSPQSLEASILILRTDPPRGRAGVSVDSLIRACLRDPVPATTIAASAFVVETGGRRVPGQANLTTWRECQSGHNVAWSFTPDRPLSGRTRYDCAIATGVRIERGELVRDFLTWSFTTGDSGSGENLVEPPRR